MFQCAANRDYLIRSKFNLSHQFRLFKTNNQHFENMRFLCFFRKDTINAFLMIFYFERFRFLAKILPKLDRFFYLVFLCVKV